MANKIFLWALFFLVLAIIVPPFIGLLNLSLNQPQTSMVSKDLAAKFVADDVKTSFSADAIITITSLKEKGAKWQAEVEIEESPHSSCPKLYKRNYELMPIIYTTENLLTNCKPPLTISHRAEAILATIQNPTISQLMFSEQSFACAFKTTAQYDASYCLKTSAEKVSEFASSTPNAEWIVAWFFKGKEVWFALNEKGTILTQK